MGVRRAARGFVDTLRLHVKAGTGGMGYPKFGGIGGNGGNVFVEAKDKWTLLRTIKKCPEKRWRSEDGRNSRKFRILGEHGGDLVIPAPAGTTVRLDAQKVLGDLDEVGARVLVARGGAGGSPVTQYSGLKGQAHNITLELKLIADVGLVGFPNAGKSTILRALSNARPKVASYPFTTLKPNLGTLVYEDLRQISVADLPGLVEGAWANVGMGHKFLRHVERTKMLLFMVDVNGFRLGPKYPHRSAMETVILLNKELELYSPELTEKPAMLVVNKMDTNMAESKLNKLLKDMENREEVIASFPEEMRPQQLVHFDDIIPCSAKLNEESVEHVKLRLREMLDVHDDITAARDVVNTTDQIKRRLVETNKRLI